MTTAAEAEAKREAWIDWMANALIRIPYLKQTQLGRIAGAHPMALKRLIEERDDVFEKVKYNRKRHGSLYDIRVGSLQHLIRLTDTARREWRRRTLIECIKYIPRSSINRIVATGEVLTRMSEEGLYGWNWDFMLPETSTDSVHAWFIPKHVDRGIIGLYILPHDGSKLGNSKTMRGILHKVIQNGKTKSLLFLVKGTHYDKILNQMLGISDKQTNLYLLPWEAFLYQPSYYLQGILDGDKETIDTSLLLSQAQQFMDVPLQYVGSFAKFIQHYNGEYQLMDIYVNGSIQRVNDWIKNHPMDRAYFHDGQSVWGHIYVQNETMLDSLDKLFRKNKTMLHAESSSDLYPDYGNL